MDWSKLLGITAAFAGVGTRVFQWYRKSTKATSAGGRDIHPSEIPELSDEISDAVNNGLMAADVPCRATVIIEYIGDLDDEVA